MPDDPEARAHKNGRIARAFLDALAASDAAAIRDLLADDIVYHFPGENALAGIYRGRDQVLAFLPRLASMLDEPVTFDVHDVLSSEAHATDLSNYYGTRRGQRYSWRVVRVFHLTDSRISEIFVTVDDQAGLDWFLADDFAPADASGVPPNRR